MFPSDINFHQHTPHVLVVDNFYRNPEQVRQEALSQKFEEDVRFYKGKRSTYKHLLPYVKEEFERLLNVKITDWILQPANGIFQITTKKDPLVWHSDHQDYAGAIYLTPNANTPDSYNEGTSFWRDKKYGYRRPPQELTAEKDEVHKIKKSKSKTKNKKGKRIPTNKIKSSPITAVQMCNEIYSEYNLTHPDNWELIDKVGAVYNRLVLWDAKMIHSASQYGDKERLVQLFFFSIAK